MFVNKTACDLTPLGQLLDPGVENQNGNFEKILTNIRKLAKKFVEILEYFLLRNLHNFRAVNT